MSHASIIEKIGPAIIAERLERPRAHVRVWKHRGIPRALYADFIAAFPEEVTLAALKTGALAHKPHGEEAVASGAVEGGSPRFDDGHHVAKDTTSPSPVSEKTTAGFCPDEPGSSVGGAA